jgi:hypothetical protein
VDVLGGVWADLPDALITAGPLQLVLAYTNYPPATAPQRFYRVRLLP